MADWYSSSVFQMLTRVRRRSSGRRKQSWSWRSGTSGRTSSWRRPKWTTGTRHCSSSWSLEVSPFCLLLSGYKSTAPRRQGVCWVTVYSYFIQIWNNMRVNKGFMIIFEWTIHIKTTVMVTILLFCGANNMRPVKRQIWDSDLVKWWCDCAHGHFCCVLVTWSCLVQSDKDAISMIGTRCCIQLLE